VPRKRTKSQEMRQRSYSVLGKFYDQLWPSKPKEWRSARQKMLGSLLPQLRTVCDLGCGTGATSIEFARRGLKVLALDLSREMCRITREKAQKEGLELRVHRADMRSFRLPAPVDLVTSEWGVINHLRRKRDLAKVIRAVFRALRPGGYFYFDLHQRRFHEGWAEPIVYDNENFFLASQGGYEPGPGCGWSEMTFFVSHPGGVWKRETHLFQQIHWSHAEILRALRSAGFDSIRLFDFRDLFAPPSPRPVRGSLRTMYLAKKSAKSVTSQVGSRRLG